MSTAEIIRTLIAMPEDGALVIDGVDVSKGGGRWWTRIGSGGVRFSKSPAAAARKVVALRNKSCPSPGGAAGKGE